MTIINSLQDIPSISSAVVTIGFFDGFHLGHKKIIDTVLSLSKDKKKSVVITFTNHPLSVISPSKAPKMISPLDYKEEFLSSKKIDYLVLLEFTPSLMKMKAISFINHILEKIKNVEFVIGSDFRFGYKNEGDSFFLKEYSMIKKFGVIVVPPVIKNGIRVSSSFIRKIITEGKVKEAKNLLGREFFVEGKVAHGDGRGKKIGFPTANIELSSEIIAPKFGVYKGFTIIDSKKYDCFIFVGNKKLGKTLDNTIVEAFIKDFDKNIYDKILRIFFESFIREVINFENTERLIEQIKMDISNFS